jgi:hypothetical protein
MEVGGSKVEVRLLAAGLSRLSFLQLEESHTYLPVGLSHQMIPLLENLRYYH